jgi:hypothetical protein
MLLKYSLLCFCMAAVNAQNLTVQVNGNPVGAESTLNLIPGGGILQVCADSQYQHRIDCTPSVNTAVIATHDTIHANENYCASTNGTMAYTCRLPNRPLTSYSAGMTFVLSVDNDCSANCSLNIDGLGAISIKKNDGDHDPGGALRAGAPQWVFFDGKVFRLVGGGGEGGGPSDQRGDRRGDVRARRVIANMDTIPYQANMTLDVTSGDVHKIRTAPGAGNATLSAATGGLAGQHMWIIVSNDPSSAKSIAFGANLLSAGPLAGIAGKSSTLHFVSDGTAWYEVSRTVGL